MKPRSYALLLVLMFCLVSCGNQRPQEPFNESAVLEVLQAQEDAWNDGDIEGYMAGYWRSDSMRFAGGNNVSYGWDSTLARYKRGFPTREAMGRLSFEGVEIDPIDRGNALAFGRWILEWEDRTRQGLFTLWFRNIDGAWKVVHDHTSVGD